MVNNDIKFQILDWNSHYVENEINDVNNNSTNAVIPNTITIKQYTIRLFGRTIDNKTIYVQVNDYTPYFYICIDETWNKKKINDFINHLKNTIVRKSDTGRWIKCSGGFLGYEVETKHKFSEFTDFKKYTFLKLIFNDYDVMKRWSNYLSKERVYSILGKKNIQFELYESNIEPMLRCMHIQNLDAVGWVKISGNMYNRLGKSTSCCQINISTEWTSLERIDSHQLMPYVIASFDIECMSQDGSFPQAKRESDKIIQIGTTFSKVGESECFYQHIVVLGSCDNIEGSTVVECKTEKELLIEWTKMIREKNPDILTGYNIFGFDYQYMRDRANKLGISESFEQLSRITGEKTEFKTKELTSSALGRNIMTYYNMIGRLNVDLMKIVQRDYKLLSYKLDYVASYFIRENICDIKYNTTTKKTELYTKSIYGTQIGRYINIYYNDGINENKHMGDKKFQIKGFDRKSIIENGVEVTYDVILVDDIIDTDILGKGYEIFWCQAKDELEPQEIFKLQKGSSTDRAKIAKYCLMDCILCNKLMNKLSIMTNSVGMANVCHVPLSYIFYRGQGIKIFSLVAKKCRIENHLIPHKEKIDKPDDEKEKELKECEQFEKFINKLNKKGVDDEELEDDDEHDGYEGATVFPPEKGVHFEPIPVLDYSSLYPRSMIMKNLSHEYFVKDDEKYGDLPGYKYHTITYVDNTIYEKVHKKNRLGSIQIFKHRLKKTVEEYRKKKYIIEHNKIGDRDITKIYDIDDDNNKRYLVTDIVINSKSFTLSNYKTAKFAEKLTGGKGIIPEILQELLDARDKTRNEMKNTEDEFQKKVLDGKQLAEKVTANSTYGQTGSPVSQIYLKPIAASTTATGKEALEFSRDFLEGHFNNLVNYSLSDTDSFLDLCDEVFCDVSNKKFNQPKNGFVNRKEFYVVFQKEMRNMLNGYHVNIKSIYGDTDSVFYKPQITNNETGEILKDKTALEWSIQIGLWSSIAICLVLDEPMQQAYEKVLYPFAILTKKRYVGNLYERDPNKFYMKSMGIVLKRRDNAPIVKVVIGGIVDQILNKKSAMGAVEYTKKILRDILSGKYPMDKFIITKTLKGSGLNKQERIEESLKDKKDRCYAERTRIVHAVLADRIADRDYGNRPQSNDRIAYLYKIVKGDVELQGDRVETPEYMIENNINIDYLFYITNQIMKPAIQFLELLIHNPEKLFKEYIVREENRRKGLKTIKSYCNKVDENCGDIIFDDIDNMNPVINITETKKNKNKKKLSSIRIDNTMNISDDINNMDAKKSTKKPIKGKKKIQLIMADNTIDTDGGFIIDM